VKSVVNQGLYMHTLQLLFLFVTLFTDALSFAANVER